MPEPKNKKLYEEVKDEIYAKHKKHSAYRSGLLVQEYKARGGEYIGKKNKSSGLNRWFREDWKTQDGKVGYKKNLMYTAQLKELMKKHLLHFQK